ncbi:hypothetical protein [Brevundimonas sp.]|uniref:hypothetical protein n=1 Tax=Brevundimonas sp. TaxID=1871086 RepID=UPI001DCF9C5B|nr:hypothetical protein [Brevundimonas sp.]MBL0948977.1 hypothetical protein [Brevundimonas sp.]
MFRDFKTLTLPFSTKIVVVVLLLMSVGANLILFGWGLMRDSSSLLSSTIELFGVLLPVILVAVVLGRADSGVSALKRRTETLYLKVLPPILAGVVDAPGDFYAPGPRVRAPKAERGGRLFVNLARGECHADLLLAAPWRREGDTVVEWKMMLAHLEVNVGRVNFALLIPEDRLVRGRAGGRALDGQAFRDAFPHTLQGASRAGAPVQPEKASSGYTFLDELIRRRILGVDHLVLVANKFLSDEFLWDSASQLYFAQDLMFMLRAFLTERPDLFVSIPGPAVPGPEAFALALAGPPAA